MYWIILLLIIMTGCQLDNSKPLPMADHTLQPFPTETPLPTPQVLTVEPADYSAGLTVCKENAGKISRETIHSPEIPGQMLFRVYTPPCYVDGKDYPVLYLLHGLSSNDDQWIRLGMTAAADRLIASGEIRPLLIVMPYNPNGYIAPDSNFGSALVESLIPWVDEQYKTCVQADCRWIGGLSRGGGWAFYIYSHYPDEFSAVGGHSPAIFTRDPEKLASILKDMPKTGRIWIDVAEQDSERNYLSTVDRLLTDADLPHLFIIHPGDHEESYWRQHVEEYLRWYVNNSLN